MLPTLGEENLSQVQPPSTYILHSSTLPSKATMSGRSLISVDSFVLISVSRTASRWREPAFRGSNFSSVEWHVPGRSGL